MMNECKKMLVMEIQKNEQLVDLVRELIKAHFVDDKKVSIALCCFNEFERFFSEEGFIPNLGCLERKIEDRMAYNNKKEEKQEQ